MKKYHETGSRAGTLQNLFNMSFFFFLASNSSLDLRATFSQGQRPTNWYRNALIFVHSSYKAYRLPSQLVGSVVSLNNTEGINGFFLDAEVPTKPQLFSQNRGPC